MKYSLKFSAVIPQYMNDLSEVIRAFYPYIIVDDESKNFIDILVVIGTESFSIEIKSSFFTKMIKTMEIQYENTLEYKRLTKRFAKNALYVFCRELTKENLPYGSLTGVRPTKLFYELEKEGLQPEEALVKNFFVSPERAALVREVTENQKGIYMVDENAVSIFVNIPFCPTRCKYCSFISTELFRVKKLIPDYIKAVKNQIQSIMSTVREKNLTVRSIYVGGGTPTSLEAEELYNMLNELKNLNVEFTVEAGRPDTITREKFEALKNLNVTRVSINPQSFNDETLKKLCREHTESMTLDAVALAREFNFDINMDLIAGLEGERLDDFILSLEKTIALRPENITVHTLCIKRGAKLKYEGFQKSVSGEVKLMVDYARGRLKDTQYYPYYMYRQKNMADNLENVGYTLQGKQCTYNIDYMEDTHSIMSAGAGAVSKTILNGGSRIEREAHPKGIHEFIQREKNKCGQV